MNAKIAGAVAGLAVLGAAGGGVAAAAGDPSASASRMDDGTQLLPQARISESRAIAAAQTRATGPLNEVDLEHRGGRLVFNVDVGSHDVKVDADTAAVVAVDADD
jgi:uncharacterized membrane protein YkoI